MLKKILSLFFVLLCLSSLALAQEATEESSPEAEWETIINHTGVQFSYPADWFASSDTDGVTVLQDAADIMDSNYMIFVIEPLYFQTESLLEAMTFGLNNVSAPLDLDDIPYEELDLEDREAIVVFWEVEPIYRAMVALRFSDNTVGLIDMQSILPLTELPEQIIGVATSFDHVEFEPDTDPNELVNTYEFENGVSFMYPANMYVQRIQEGVVIIRRPHFDLILSTSPFIRVEGTVALQALLQHGLNVAEVPVEGIDYEYDVLDFGERIAIAYPYDRDRLTDGMVIAIRMSDGTIGLMDVVYGKDQLEQNVVLIMAVLASFDSDPDDVLEELFTLEEEETLNANWREDQSTAVVVTEEAGD